MRPDTEDYEEVETTPGGSRAMSWMVLAVAVGGFASLAYYAYQSGTKAPGDGEVVMIEADGTPIKTTPTDPEGEQFPNQDKTIYDAIDPDNDKTVEKILPDPERPVAAANMEDSEDDVPVAKTSPETVSAVANNNAPAKSSGSATTFVAPDHVQKPVEKTEPAPATKPEKSYESPEMINEKPVAKKAEPKPEPKAAEKPAAKSSGGAYMIQLGAFKSEEEAQASWKKIRGKHSDVLNGEPTIVKAELEKGTFYRLRTGSYASSAEAKAACAKMPGQACMPVK